jgi:hypothetical protein
MYLFNTAHSMAGVENPAFDRDQQILVSSVIMFSLSGFAYVRTR